MPDSERDYASEVHCLQQLDNAAATGETLKTLLQGKESHECIPTSSVPSEAQKALCYYSWTEFSVQQSNSAAEKCDDRREPRGPLRDDVSGRFQIKHSLTLECGVHGFILIVLYPFPTD